MKSSDLQNKIKSYEMVANNLAKLAINTNNDDVTDIYNIYLYDCETKLKKMRQKIKNTNK